MKLVRDLIPDIVAAKGETEPFRDVAGAEEHDHLLDLKLDEELAEWREANEPIELADLLAVIRSIAIRQGIGWRQLLDMEREKRRRCGGFEAGVVWLGSQRRPYDPEPPA